MFDIGFIDISIWDVLDILIVGYLIFRIYNLLKGSIAFNIFIGVVTLYLIWALVGQLEMELLTVLLDQLVSVGVIVLIIIFQPEVRRFLLLVGRTTLKQRPGFLQRILDRNLRKGEAYEPYVTIIKETLLSFQKAKTGAIIVFSGGVETDGIQQTGIVLRAEISQPLLESIFNKNSPLHDGAVIMRNNQILAASCILPLTVETNLHYKLGLRHRAAVGVSERLEVTAFVVSEETGIISMAHNGKLTRKIKGKDLEDLIKQHYQ